MYFSNPTINTKKDAFVAIQEVQTDDAPEQSLPRSQTAKLTWHGRFTRHIRRFAWRFFPFVGEPPPEHVEELHKRASFPWLGLLCLLTALSTLAFSFLIFKVIDRKEQIQNKYLKPASWLSALISVNSIVLHIALSEGVTNAWWYKASRKDVTLQELHETWTMGTSTVAVLLSGKKFNYVAMATIFVATVPLNGFLLQNAVSLQADTNQNFTTLYLPLVDQLPLGFSADMTNGTIESWSEGMSSIAASVDGFSSNLPPGVFDVAGGELGNVAYEDLGCTNGDRSAVCKTNITLPGFNLSCTTTMDQHYDLRPSQHGDSTFRTRVFSSEVTWNATTPYLINLDIMYKPNFTCNGLFERRRCQFNAAKMKLPVQINSDQGFNIGTDYANPRYASPVVSLDRNTTIDYHSVGDIPNYPAESEQNSTYGGFASWLGQYFNGSIDWTYKDGRWSSNRSGLVTNTYQLNTILYSQNETGGAIFDDGTGTPGRPLPFTPAPNNASWCENTYSGLDWVSDSYNANNLVDTVFQRLNTLMLGASAAQFSSQWLNNDTFWNIWWNTTSPDDAIILTKEYHRLAIPVKDAMQRQNVLRYDIRYGYWGASVAVTVFVVFMIIPLFFGFWHLDRRATLSPFETAAAFNAPVIAGADMKKGTSVLLKEIGKQPVHGLGGGSSDRNTNVPLQNQRPSPS